MNEEERQMDDTTLTRTDATKFLSTEFIVGLVFQSIVFLIVGSIGWGQLKAEVQSVREAQATAEMTENPTKIARIEEQLKSVSASQYEMKGDIKELVQSVDALKDEVRRSRK